MKTTSIAAIKLWIFLLYKGQRAYVCVFAIGDRTVYPNELKFGSEVGFNPEKVIVNIRARYPTPMGPQGRGGPKTGFWGPHTPKGFYKSLVCQVESNHTCLQV